MSEYIVELPDGSEADEFVAKMGLKGCRIYGYRLTGEVVRCRDCRRFNEYHGKCHRQSGVLIDDYSTRRLEDLGDVLVLADAGPDGYCAWGERLEA